MTMRHVVLFRWKEGTPPEAVDAIAGALRGLTASMPVVRAYACGPSLGLSEGSFDFGIVGEFATVEDWATYRDDPTHQAIIRDQIRPIMAERSAIQYEV